MGTREVLLAAVIPAVVAVVLFAALHLWGRVAGGRPAPAGDGGETTTPSPAAAAATRGWVFAAVFALLVSGLTVLGSYAWQSEVAIWSDSVTHRVPAMALAAGVLGLVGTLTPIRKSAIGLGVLGAVGGWFAGWAVLSGLHESLIGEGARWGWIGGVGVIAGVQAWAMALGVRALPGWRGPVLVWLVVGVAALGATAGLANAPLVLWPTAAAAFGLAVVGVLRRDVDLLAGATPAIALVFMGALSLSHWFGSEERWLMFGLLSAGPVGIGAAALLRGKPGWVRLVVAGIVSLGLVGAQAAVSVPGLIEASSGSGGDEDYYYDY